MSNSNSPAEIILRQRYYAEGETEEKQMYRRVAKAMNDPENEENFYCMMADHIFLPNSPTLMNAGKPGAQMAACFVVGIEDSMESIADALKTQMLIHKSGGGTGFNFSPLRAKGSAVHGTRGVASGPVSFMSLFDLATDVVQQGGARRGANMGILDCDHPDILEFVQCKNDKSRFKNFNISVRVTDEFMKNRYDDGNKEIWDAIVESAWQTGEPGLLFGDEIERKNTTPQLGPLTATNPCGESPLYHGEACNLGSINLTKFVMEDRKFDFLKFSYYVRLAVRFLDDVIDVNCYPNEEIRDRVLLTRKIGLGIMGYADMLYMMRIPYGSTSALITLKEIMETIYKFGRNESNQLAKERGVFPSGTRNMDAGFRNATITCIAPTGTISQIAGCSSGIEPNWAIKYKRRAFVKEVPGGVELEWTNPYVENYDPKIHLVAHEIPWKAHIETQSVAQEYTDLAVSKTINMPNDATRKDVEDALVMAWKYRCKGITVYRDGCREGQPLESARKPIEKKKAPKRAPILEGRTAKIPTSLGTVYLTLNGEPPEELFATIGKSGRDITADAEAIGRLASLALRHGASTEELVRQLKGIGGALPVWDDAGQSVLSIPDAVARGIEALTGEVVALQTGDICPVCGSLLIREEGCLHCTCGYSRC